MLLSHRLAINRTKLIGYDLPEDPDLVTDSIVLKLIAISGGHQRMISLSRCHRLTSNSLGNIPRCQGLQYLNLSYTSIENISPLASLPMLRSLSLAGLNLINYEDLRYLVTLEVLNVQFSNFSKCELLLDFQQLRSLDFGHTPISSLRGIETHTRLEELFLDSTPQITDLNRQQIVDSLKNLTNIQLLQIGNSALTKSFKSFQSFFSPLALIVTKPRRIIWFENIINNNYEEVRKLILNGQDVNLRSGPEDLDLFTYYYITKCQMKTDYFDCCSLVEAYRPCATHVAIVFNCQETLALLISSQCKKRCSVWYGKVSQSEDEVILSDEEEDEEGDEEKEELPPPSTQDRQKVPSRGRSAEIMPLKSWGKQSTFRKQSIAQVRQLTHTLAPQPSQRFLQPLAQGKNEKIFDDNKERKDKNFPPIPMGKSSSSPHSLSRKGSSRSGSVIRRPTLRADSTQKVKFCVTNDLEDFIERVFESGTHRVIERMTERRITSWKQECRGIADKLLATLKQTKLVTSLDQSFQPPAADIQEPSVPSIDPSTSLLQPDEINRNELSSAPLSVNGDIPISVPLEVPPELQDPQLIEHEETAEERETREREEIEREEREKKEKIRAEYLPSVLEMSPYDGLVSKLNIPQIYLISNEIDSKQILTKTLLGLKSFEDEGRRQTVRNRAKKEEEEIEREREKQGREKNFDPSKSEYFFREDHVLTRSERKRLLVDLIKQRKNDLN